MWSEWQSVGSCSKSCGSGTQSYSRSCTNPAPLHNGNDCSGDEQKSESCNDAPCPSMFSGFCKLCIQKLYCRTVINVMQLMGLGRSGKVLVPVRRPVKLDLNHTREVAPIRPHRTTEMIALEMQQKWRHAIILHAQVF